MSKNSKISMRVSDQFMSIVTFVSDTLAISKTKAVMFMAIMGYKDFTDPGDMVNKYEEIKETIKW